MVVAVLLVGIALASSLLLAAGDAEPLPRLAIAIGCELGDDESSSDW